MASTLVIEAAVAIVSLVDEGYVFGLQSSGVLAHPLRHRIVSILLDRDTIQRDELAAVLAADETLPRDDSERTEIALHHDHLPRLADKLLIEYDQRNGDIRLWKDPESAADLLESS